MERLAAPVATCLFLALCLSVLSAVIACVSFVVPALSFAPPIIVLASALSSFAIHGSLLLLISKHFDLTSY